MADLIPDCADEPEAEQVYLGWADRLHAWFAEHPDLADRALMIAAATLAPVTETELLGAASVLARRLKIETVGGGLFWQPSTRITDLLDADSEDGRILFRRQNFAASVLRHICAEYPLLPRDLISWLTDLPMDPTVDLKKPGLRRRAAETLADLATETSTPEAVARAAETWTQGRGRAVDLAFIALSRTCLHPRIGGRIRRHIYGWSRSADTSPQLRLTSAWVCEVMGQTHLPIALTRLKHLATHGDARVNEAVGKAAVALGSDDPLEVYFAALDWCRSAPDLSARYAFSRLDVGLRVADELLREHETLDPKFLSNTIRHLLKFGDPGFRPRLLRAAIELAEGYRAAVIREALSWAAYADADPELAWSLGTAGAELFLALAAATPPDQPLSALVGPDAVDPAACFPVWAVALTSNTVVGSSPTSWLWSGAGSTPLSPAPTSDPASWPPSPLRSAPTSTEASASPSWSTSGPPRTLIAAR